MAAFVFTRVGSNVMAVVDGKPQLLALPVAADIDADDDAAVYTDARGFSFVIRTVDTVNGGDITGGAKARAEALASQIFFLVESEFADYMMGYYSPFPGQTFGTTWLIRDAATPTATARTISSTNLFTSLPRIGYVTAATANGLTGTRSNFHYMWRGNAAKLGGFEYRCVFGNSSAALVAEQKIFAGVLNNLNAITGAVVPTDMTDIVGVAKLSADTNLSIIHNDASGVATKIDLGVNFPGNTLSTDVYELTLFCPSNANYITWRVRRLNTGHVLQGVITTNIPANNVMLTSQLWTGNGATALAAAIDVMSQYAKVNMK